MKMLVNVLKHAHNHSVHHVEEGSVFEMALLNKVRSQLLWNVTNKAPTALFADRLHPSHWLTLNLAFSFR